MFVLSSVQCQQHNWFKCRDKTRELLSAVSNTSIEYRRCITSAVLERVSPVSVDPLQIAADAPAGPGAVDEAVETAAGNNQSPQTHEDPSVSCTLDGQAKVMPLVLFVRSHLPYSGSWSTCDVCYQHHVVAVQCYGLGLALDKTFVYVSIHLLLVSFSLSQETAREHYCNILTISSGRFVHNYMDNDVAHPGLTGLAHCGVTYYRSDEIFTPDELLTSLKAWYTRTVSDLLLRLH